MHDAGRGTKSWVARIVWRAPADTSVPGESYFALLEGSDVSEGERLIAWAAVGHPESGVAGAGGGILLSEAPGFAPQQVEELVTRQVESTVNGSAGLATLRSESIPGLSVVTVTFADGIDLHVARQGIAERLSELGSSLPAGVGAPKLSPLVSSTMDLLKIGLVLDRVDAYTLRDYADWVIKPRLLAVPGVAHVIVFGGDVRQIQVLPDAHKLSSFNLSFSEEADAAKAALRCAAPASSISPRSGFCCNRRPRSRTSGQWDKR